MLSFTVPASANYSVIGRALTVLDLAAKKPVTRYQVAEELGIHDRTAHRLLKSLVDFGLVEVAYQSDGYLETTYRAAVRLTRC